MPALTKAAGFYLSLAASYNQTFDEYDMPVHSHEYYEFMFVNSGKCDVFVEEKSGAMETLTLGKSDFVLIDANVKHRLFVTPHSPCNIMNIEINAQKIDPSSEYIYDFGRILQAYKNLKRIFTRFRYGKFRDTNRIKDTLERIQSVYDASMADPARTAEKALLQILLGELFLETDQCAEQVNSSGNIYVQKTYEYIKNHYQDEITLQSLANYLNIHPTYIQRLIRGVSEDSVHSLINKFRIQKAIELLRSSSLPLIDVAIEVGFNNRQSFFNAFKKYTGVSPNEYRREHIDNEKWLKNESYTTSVFEDEG